MSCGDSGVSVRVKVTTVQPWTDNNFPSLAREAERSAAPEMRASQEVMAET